MSHGRQLRVPMAALAALLVLAVAAPAGAAVPRPVDPQLRAVPVLEEVDVPTTVRFAPDGRLFVAEKDGRVLAFKGPDDSNPVVAVDLRTEVHDFSDRGLLGLALDPGFAVNRRLYLLYTRDAPPGETAPRWNDDCPDPPGQLDAGCVASGRLVRVTLGALGTAERTVPLIEHEWCQQFPGHSIGTVLFGPDGMLYVGAGEGAHYGQTDYGQFGGKGPTPPNPCGDPPTGRGVATSWPTGEGGALRAQDVRTPGDPTGLDGAIIRVHPDTGAAVPGGPFAARSDANARRIIAYGLRNPFRFAVRPGTRELWVNDVGWGRREPVQRIRDATDGVAENFGWPCYEGGVAAEKTSYGGLSLCTSLPPDAVTQPWFAYQHRTKVSADDSCSSASGSSLSGIAFGSSQTYGPRYHGAVFFADYARNCIYMAPKGTDGVPNASAVSLFAAGNAGGGGPVDLQLGPDGNLYVVHFDWGNPDATAVVRIEPTGGAPTARATATPAAGPVPLRSRLSAAGSTDPDGDPLTYAWDLDGDGQFDDDTRKELDHVFTEVVTVGLRARDPSGRESVARVVVQAGNTPPRVEVLAPAAGTTFRVGEPIALRARAVDAQDGELDAGRLDWTATIQHCSATGCHSHPHQQWPRTASATLVAPDHELPSYVALRVSARDSGGLVDSADVRLDPRTATLTVRTEPTGLQVQAGEAGGPSPRAVPVMAGSNVSVRVPARQTLAGVEWLLAGWADGASGAERLVPVDRDTVLTARFAAPSAQQAPPTTSPDPVVDPPPPTPTPAPAPDRLAPRLVLRTPLRVGLRRPLAVRVACPEERCAATVRTTARIAGRTRLIARFERRLWPGRTVRRSLSLRPVRAAARRALRRGTPVKARIVARASDAAGNRQRARRIVRLVR